MFDEHTYHCDKYNSIEEQNGKNGCQVGTKKDTRFTNEAAGEYMKCEFIREVNCSLGLGVTRSILTRSIDMRSILTRSTHEINSIFFALIANDNSISLGPQIYINVMSYKVIYLLNNLIGVTTCRYNSHEINLPRDQLNFFVLITNDNSISLGPQIYI